jgi:hypothetical protein
MFVEFRTILIVTALLLLTHLPRLAEAQGAPPTTQPAASTAPAIDWDRARVLYQRDQRHEALTDEERAYLDRAKAARASAPGQGGAAAGVKPPPPPSETTGLVPLTDLKGTEKYKGQDGGLYGGGRNDPPASQKKLALEAAAKILPRDAEGKPAPDGKIVLLAIGMSNTTMEFSRFKVLADGKDTKNPNLVIVDGAQGGKDATAWKDPASREQVWQTADRRIADRGVAGPQVQVIWIKQALMGPSRLGEFPKHSDVLRDDLIDILNLARQRYPNVQLAYLSSRIYAGYATTPLNPEPYSYESAFAVRAVIQKQIAGEGDMASAAGKVPVVLWGPYLWTDGTKGRKVDDLLWQKEDVGNDGTHPSQSGQRKVADLLWKFFSTDETTKAWFLKPGGQP